MVEGFNTLQDFMMHSKGIVYLLAVGYLVGFVWFWKFLTKYDRKDDME